MYFYPPLSLTPPTGWIWPYPTPTQAQDLILYWDDPIAQFPDLTTAVALPVGYAKAIRLNLAVELAPEFGRQLDPVVAKLAAMSLADLKRINLPMVEINNDPAILSSRRSRYFILSDR